MVEKKSSKKKVVKVASKKEPVNEYKESVKNIGNEIENIKKQIRKDIKKDPVKSTAVAFGVGVALGGILKMLGGGRR